MAATQMRAIGINAFGGPSQLELMTVPIPTIGPDQVLIHLRAAGVGPWDCSIRRGDWGALPGFPFPYICGAEGAGVVEQVGANVTNLHEGDEVYYYAPPLGNYAEYAAVPAAIVARKPATLDFPQAVALPCSALTAYQTLTEALNLQAGETLYMTAAAGGTGTFAVPLAVARGVHVIGTASARNHAYLRDLGAQEVVDYTAGDVVEAVRAAHPGGVDAVFDTLGGASLQQSFALLRDGGRLAYITLPEQVTPPRGISVQHVIGRPDAAQLALIAQMVDEGQLHVHLDSVLPLEDAPRAHELIESGHVRGKVVLTI
jgi:NADPH:quinone reductase-like Zn-dependent oxidoreductase